MTQLTLVQRFMHLMKKEYVDLEIRSDSFDKKELKRYVDDVIESIEVKHPELSVIYTKYSRELEIHRHPLLASLGIKFSGYLVRVASNINPYDLKQTSIGLEINEDGERVSDIDIYLSDNTKISRKP